MNQPRRDLASTRERRHLRPIQLRRPMWAACLLPVLLAACGGGGSGDGGTTSASCTVAEHKSWVGDYMNDWYFWYRVSPRPDPTPYADAPSYFNALLYTGGTAAFPQADRFSGSQTTEAFNRFFGDGASLGYGLSVAGLELAGDGNKPLYVRYVEPLSPAASSGVQRGDRVVSINGRSAADLVTADDFSTLTALQAGDTLSLVLRRAGVDRSVSLRADVFNLTPVTGTQVVTTAGGRRVGYVAVKDMISQALAPLETAFSRFKAEGVQDVVLDLRYNGGGLVSTGGTLASYVAGVRGTGLNYASLLYNDKRAATNNENFRFSNPNSALGLPRVFVLMGRRTCSASEQLINGLRGANIEVVAVGETTCGKPVGFLPTNACGRTYSVVNFESVNHRNEGRYFDGLAPVCVVSEDFTAAQGGTADPLMNAAKVAADTGFCPAVSAERASPLAARAGSLGTDSTSPRRRFDLNEGDGRLGMVAR